jgi:hypothetical protein
MRCFFNSVNLWSVELTEKDVQDKKDPELIKKVYYCNICVLQDNPRSQFNINVFGEDNRELAKTFKKLEGQKIDFSVDMKPLKDGGYFIAKIYEPVLVK